MKTGIRHLELARFAIAFALVLNAVDVGAQEKGDSTLATQKPVVVLTRHRAGVTAMKFSPDGQILASADLHGSIFLWRTRDWAVIRTLQHGAEIYSIAFSPNGRMLASTGGNNSVTLWDVGSGTKLRSISSDRRALAVTFAPSGELLFGTEDGVIHIVDPSTARELRTLKTDGSIWSVSVSADGSELATGLPLRIYDYRTLTLKARGQSLAQLGLAFSGDGRRLASAESTGGALLWNFGDSLTWIPLRLNVQRRASGSRGYDSFVVNMPAAAIDMSRDGARIAAGGTDARIYLWTVPRLASAPTDSLRLGGHSMSVTAIALSPGASLVASGSLDRTIRIWSWPRQ